MKVLPLYLPHQGCSHTCIYCNQPLVAGTKNDRKEWTTRIQNQIKTYPEEEWEIAFYGGTFSALTRKQMRDCFEELIPFTASPQIKGFRLSTRPDSVGNSTLEFLRDNGVTTIELGVESLDEAVLHQCGRGHSAKESKGACIRVKSYGFDLGVHLMCGLPDQSFQSWKQTVLETIPLQPDFVRLSPVLVLKNTPLEKLYQRGMFTPLSLEEAINQCCYGYSQFHRENIRIARIGLALSDSTGDGSDKVAAGPWHPSLRHEVESRLAGETLMQISNRTGERTYTINPRDYSIVIGSRKRNLKMWKDNLESGIQIERCNSQPRFTFKDSKGNSYSLFEQTNE